LFVGVASALFLFALGMKILTERIIIRPIKRLEDVSKNMASGDLSTGIDIKGNDEIASLSVTTNKMASNLKDMIAKIVAISQNVSRATENVVTTSGEVLDVSDMQKAEIQSATLAVQEMGVAIAHVAESTKSLSQVAHETSAAVMQTKTSMESIAENANINSESAQETASIIEELLANIKQVADSTEKLTDSSIGIASSIEEVNATTKDIDDRAKESVVLADAVMKNASERGMKALNAAIKGMQNIRSDIFSLSETVNKLGKKSVDIGKILNVIDDVADRTTLLALNAAILASQSGEHGKGFAVVAEEIKALARRTTESTSEISGLIKSVQAETSSSVKMVSDSINTVESGMKLVNDLNETLKSIIESSKASTSMARAIQRATEEEALVINNITVSIEHVTGQTGKIASAIQEQSKGGNFIIKETEKVRNLSGNIQKAVNEQKEGISRMAELAENISEQTIQMAGATGRHEEKSVDIVKSMDKIRSTSNSLADASNAMNEVISLLHKDAMNLLEEMNKFKV
jgi:methyl-accepting chemotaxis protein